MRTEEFIKLYEKYISGQCSPFEEKLLFENKHIFKIVDLDENLLSNNDLTDLEIRDRVYKEIEKSISTTQLAKVNFNKQWMAIAAALFVIFSLGILVFNKNKTSSNTRFVKYDVIKPGKEKALLVLADGSTIQLDEARNGILSSDDKTTILKADNGMLIYEDEGLSDQKINASLNTISIPRGGKYQIKLPDGTLVWLNSESSLTFPTFFSGTERVVNLKGEAYFEVAKNKDMPFKVKTAHLNVEVLGTHFNVAAYAGKSSVKTTLLEGSVKLSDKLNGEILLSPGEQGRPSNTGFTVLKVKTAEVIAWKDGYFVFRENTIEEIMEQLQRWYDVEIEYKGKANHHHFGGVYSKNKDLLELLKGLELTGLVHFKIEGRRIIVMS